jgi:hypothetical protein
MTRCSTLERCLKARGLRGHARSLVVCTKTAEENGGWRCYALSTTAFERLSTRRIIDIITPDTFPFPHPRTISNQFPICRNLHLKIRNHIVRQFAHPSTISSLIPLRILPHLPSRSLKQRPCARNKPRRSNLLKVPFAERFQHRGKLCRKGIHRTWTGRVGRGWHEGKCRGAMFCPVGGVTEAGDEGISGY